MWDVYTGAKNKNTCTWYGIALSFWGRSYNCLTGILSSLPSSTNFTCQNKWVSEWLLFNANSAIFQLCHGENKISFNEMMISKYMKKRNIIFTKSKKKSIIETALYIKFESEICWKIYDRVGQDF